MSFIPLLQWCCTGKSDSFNAASRAHWFPYHWLLDIMSLWHVSLEETRCCHIGYSFSLAVRALLCALSHSQDTNLDSLWWVKCGPLVGTENSPNCKYICHAGGSKPLQQIALPPELHPSPCCCNNNPYRYALWLDLSRRLMKMGNIWP